jgi:hypothetical protein
MTHPSLKKSRAQTAGCSCIETVNRLLEPQNRRLVLSFNVLLRDLRAVVVTEKRNPRLRTRPSHMIASFCPFCGRAYPEAQDR